MSDEPYTPDMEDMRNAWEYNAHVSGVPESEAEAEFDRFIAKVKADALREWADFQEKTLQTHIQAADPEDMEEVRAWTEAVRNYADQIEGEA